MLYFPGGRQGRTAELPQIAASPATARAFGVKARSYPPSGSFRFLKKWYDEFVAPSDIGVFVALAGDSASASLPAAHAKTRQFFRMDTKLAAANVIELLGVFPRSFCAYGTALGVVREGAILAHDKDTDIGILSEDFLWKSVAEAVRRGWVIVHVFGMRHLGLEVSLSRDGVKTDVMVFYPQGDKFTNFLWDNGGRNGLADRIVHEYPAPIMSVEDWDLRGTPVRTLGPAYLAHVYGDWRTPVKSWDWRTDHKCRV